MRKTVPLLMLFGLILAGCQMPWSSGEETDEQQQQDEQSVIGQIDYYDPIEWPAEEVMQGKEDYYASKMLDWYSDVDSFMSNAAESMEIYKAGIFVGGEYDGQTLVDLAPYVEGPRFSSTFMRFAVDETTDKWTLLAPYSYYQTDEEWLVAVPIDAIDNTISLPELTAPESLNAYEHDKLNLSSDLIMTESRLVEAGAQEITLNDESFGKYYIKSGCIYGVHPDGIVAKYTVTPEEFMTNGESMLVSKELTIELTNGTSFTKTYSLNPGGGCGFIVDCLEQDTFSTEDEAKLIEIGQIANGRTVFKLETIEVGEFETGTPEYLANTMYNNYKAQHTYQNSEEELLSIQEISDENSLLFMQLDNGKYTSLFDSEYAPVAECGKPVIYLYPETETTVNVQVGVDELTVTDPIYGEDGWNVIAEPDGTLTNLADEQEYPYLFWEGNSDEALSLSPGFTLSKKSIVKELPSVLQDLGLNATETADFMEFWLPRLLAERGKYVEFNFVPQQLFDQVAPLTITPQPDKVIRVFMVYKGTDQAGLPVPDFNTPKRYGFTVVEWGGDLH